MCSMFLGCLDYWTVWETLREDGVPVTLRECKVVVREYYERSAEYSNEIWFQEAVSSERAFSERTYIEAVQKLAWQDLQDEGKRVSSRISRVERMDDMENNLEYQLVKQKVLLDYPSSDVKLGVVFWEEDYRYFIEACTPNGIVSVFDLLLGDLNELRGICGYNKNHIEKIRQRLISWCDKTCKASRKEDQKADETLLAELRGLFFEENDEELMADSMST